jgi:hypothetical protein
MVMTVDMEATSVEDITVDATGSNAGITVSISATSITIAAIGTTINTNVHLNTIKPHSL